LAKKPKDFYQRVYDTVRNIPQGKVCTYGIIAAHIGSPRAARMVGSALNKSYLQDEYIPAHRVVNRNGVLTGKNHFGSTEYMQKILEAEGISVVDNQIQNLEAHLWEPA
jgi:methylated-DNA-protein-cysteine methyltransferase related protein